MLCPVILGDEYKDIIIDFDNIKSFMIGLNSFVNKSKNLKVNYESDQLDILLDSLISFYNEIDFNPAYLKRHLVISDKLFSYTYTRLHFKIPEQQKNDFNNKFKLAYKNILDTFIRQYALLDYSLAKYKFYNLSIRIESILEKYILIAEAYALTGATEIIKDIPSGSSANIIFTSSSTSKEKSSSITNNKAQMNKRDITTSPEEQIQMQEIAELKTKFLFLHELGIIKHIETEYLKNNSHRTDKAIATIIATILQIDKASQKESIRTYVRDLNKDDFYKDKQKDKVKKLMQNLNLIN